MQKQGVCSQLVPTYACFRDLRFTAKQCDRPLLVTPADWPLSLQELRAGSFVVASKVRSGREIASMGSPVPAQLLLVYTLVAVYAISYMAQVSSTALGSPKSFWCAFDRGDRNPTSHACATKMAKMACL